MPGALAYNAIVLAGGDDRRLHPLTGSLVKALLPVANRPLISYALKSLQDAGLPKVFVVVMGDEPAKAIQEWATKEWPQQSRMQLEVIKAKDNQGTADALRAVADKLTARTLVVMSGDLLTDFPINALVAKHQMDGALATALLFRRKVSPTTETKPGKAPKNVDYIGLDSSAERLLFYASSQETLKELKVPGNMVARYGCVSIASDLVDAHLYVFDRSVLQLLAARPNLSSVRQDLLPFLTQQQLKRPVGAPLDVEALAAALGGVTQVVPAHRSGGATSSSGDLHGTGTGEDVEVPGVRVMELSHSVPAQQPAHDSALRVVIVKPPVYCARISDAASYGDVNRDVADAKTALHLTGLSASSQHDNVVPASTQLGNKSTIAASCVLGENCALGDKSSIKRSVLGNNCKLGANVKIINSVLQDNVVVGDGCTIQNSILCSGAMVKERAALKDCQVGSMFTVSCGQDYHGDVLSHKPALPLS